VVSSALVIPALIGRTAVGLAQRRGSAAGAIAGHPIGRQAGQRLARAELSKSIYHPHQSVTQRIVNAVRSLLGTLFNVGNSFPGGWWAAVALAALLVFVAVVVLARVGPLARSHASSDHRVPGVQSLSAADYRRRAGRLAAAGDYAGAILETVRAMARELEERAVLAPRIGRTADEIAEEAAQVLPRDAGALREAARLFDDVCYGQRPGTAAGYGLVRDLDTHIASARLKATVGHPGRETEPAGASAGDAP
jgi:hypothetical protein